MKRWKRYVVSAIYKADVELVVVVEDGQDPNNPENWIEIESECQTDYSLYDNEAPVELREDEE